MVTGRGAEQRPDRHLHRAGVGSGDDPELVVGGKAEQRVGALDRFVPACALPSAPRCERPSARCRAVRATSPAAWRRGRTRNMGAGRVGGFAARTRAPAAVVSVNITLLAESSRRVGTAWPGAGSNGWIAAAARRRERFAHAAAAQQLEFARIRLPRGANRTIHRSYSATRPGERNAKVEFVNHPRAVSTPASARWAIRVSARGLGSSLSWMRFGAAPLRACVRVLERDHMTQVLAATTGLVSRPRSVHSRWLKAAPLPRFRSRPGGSFRHSARRSSPGPAMPPPA